jgi:hypothetical protein
MNKSEAGKLGGRKKNPRKGFGSAEVLRKALETRRRRLASKEADRIEAGIILPHEIQGKTEEERKSILERGIK